MHFLLKHVLIICFYDKFPIYFLFFFISGGKNDDDEFMLNYLRSSIDYENDKSLVDIIQKIEAVQSQVQELKTRCDRVISENPGKFCSVNQLTVHRPSDGLNHSDPQTAIFAGNENSFSVRFSH